MVVCKLAVCLHLCSACLTEQSSFGRGRQLVQSRQAYSECPNAWGLSQLSQCAVVLSSRDSSDRVMEPNVSEWRVDHSLDPELNAMVAMADAYTQPVFLQ